ncbi:MAG: alanine/glycine:cation symporter family protein [Bacteroidota bacterium]|nr:alanine/glycine:cation symporter family protein [Bacteroidota bacterium]
MSDFLKTLGDNLIAFGDFMWGLPLLILLLGGGLYLFFYSRLIPLKYLGHGLKVLRGKYDNPDEPGQISHYQAVSTALAATVGMGNISGIAIAIATGGPGAVFWMWVSAFIGVSIKFFTCSLAVMYRGEDSEGNLQGGPMYVIKYGMKKYWHWLAVVFSVAAMIGVTPIFQANQLTQAIRDVILIPNGVETGFVTNLISGLVMSGLVILVLFGGIKRIAKVASLLVPAMVVVYVIAVLYILASNASEVIPGFKLIITDAFTGDAVLGGALGALIIVGVRRAAFSNEAGIGTAPMAHGAAKTSEPIREGLAAMFEPIIDTIIVCTMTALAIIVTGAWTDTSLDGIGLTVRAFSIAMPGVGPYILMLCVIVFAVTTMFAFPYYGAKSFSFLFGAKRKNIYYIFYIIIIPIGATSTLAAVIGLIDGAYATMAFPTMISAIILAPKVLKAAKIYFEKLKTSH